ncbi:MAG: AsnC family transcriptional regulator [Euryarchaeota archaeon]|nr:AsnC family transcriptional regulator [Euryarchaeota archaeon]
MKVDTLDAGIMRTLGHPNIFQWNVRVSFADIARDLGVDEETVRARILRMQESGLIEGWEVVVNPGLLGRLMTRVEFPRPDPASKEKVHDALMMADGAKWLFEYYVAGPAVVFFNPSGAAFERQLALLANITGPPASRASVTCPPATIEPSETDWKIIAALRRGARRPYDEIAEEIGLSERTLRRRVDALTAGRAVILSVITGPLKVDSGVMFHMGVEYGDTKARSAVDGELKELPGLVFSSFEGPASRVSGVIESMLELDKRRDHFAKMQGVKAVRADVQLARRSITHWMDEEVERRARGEGK